MPLGNSSNRIPGFQQIRRLRLLGPVSLEQPGVTRIHLGLAGPLETRIGPVFRKINEIVFFCSPHGNTANLITFTIVQKSREQDSTIGFNQ